MSENNQPERRLMRVRMSIEFMQQFMTQGTELECVRVTKGIPADAVFIASMFDQSRMEASLVFSHESFPLVAAGEEIPEFTPEYARYTSVEIMRQLNK